MDPVVVLSVIGKGLTAASDADGQVDGWKIGRA